MSYRSWLYAAWWILGLALPALADPPKPQEWTLQGPLTNPPPQTNPALPLSDQANKGQWTLDPQFSDDFKEPSLDLTRWHLMPTSPGDWTGRQPALFYPPNVTVTNGELRVTDRRGDVPEMDKYPNRGYVGYTTGYVQTQQLSGYGYYEIRAKAMPSAFTSAFWLANAEDPVNRTEIDIFEIGARAHGFENAYNMHAHVWSTPQAPKQHWAVGSAWQAPWKLGDDFHTYGFEWNKNKLFWYVDGVLVRSQQNTNWFFPMHIIFDSEPMLDWFGVWRDEDLPSTFEVQYLHVWRVPAQ
jgi:beta-glucanase (GH16 family)